MKWDKSYDCPVFDTPSGNLEDDQYAVVNPFKYAVKRAGEKESLVYINQTILNEGEYTDFDKNNYMVWRKGQDGSLEAKVGFDNTDLKEVPAKPYDITGLTLVNLAGVKYINEFTYPTDGTVYQDEITQQEYESLKTGGTPIKK